MSNLFLSSTENQEIKNLERLSIVIFLFLSTVIIVCGLMLSYLISNNYYATACVLAGIVGSATSGLLSSLQRRASGWELEDGTKLPTNRDKNNTNGQNNDNREMFSLRMSSFFMFRPFLGIIAGLVIYYGLDLLPGLPEISDADGTLTKGESQLNLNGPNEIFRTLIFYSLIAGLFVKTMIDVLKGIFKSVFNRA